MVGDVHDDLGVLNGCDFELSRGGRLPMDGGVRGVLHEVAGGGGEGGLAGRSPPGCPPMRGNVIPGSIPMTPALAAVVAIAGDGNVNGDIME